MADAHNLEKLTSLGQEMLEELGTPMADKSLILFDQSGHGFASSEMDKLVEEVIHFVEQYK